MDSLTYLLMEVIGANLLEALSHLGNALLDGQIMLQDQPNYCGIIIPEKGN